MQRIGRLFLSLAMLWSTSQAMAQNVFFGERNRDDSQAAIHFDREGFPYPDHFISDSSMTNAGGSLFAWFIRHNEDFIAICAHYDYFPESIDLKTTAELGKRIIRRWTDSINAKSAGYPAVAFYVHGYRKAFAQQDEGVTSVAEFQLLKENLATYGKPKAYEVEVYWDGMYGCCFSTDRKKNKELFELFETACTNARWTGENFRKVLLGIESRHVQIVAHSLGACMVTHALFDVEPPAAGTAPTPNQPDIRVSLIAPAIGGTETFGRFYDRQTHYDFKTADNYRFQIVYNEEDFVLEKKDPKIGLFGPGTKKYGPTSLGCNHRGEVKKVQKLFAEKYPNSALEVVDKTRLGKCHSLRCYATNENLREVSDFLWK